MQIHGMSRTPEYKAWKNMRQRCSNPKHPLYKYYGGRGIKVCLRWQRSFIEFFKDMGERPAVGYDLDRKNNNGGYTPKNTSWRLHQLNCQNRRTTLLSPKKVSFIRKSKKSGTELANKFKVSLRAISSIRKGLKWSNVV